MGATRRTLGALAAASVLEAALFAVSTFQAQAQTVDCSALVLHNRRVVRARLVLDPAHGDPALEVHVEWPTEEGETFDALRFEADGVVTELRAPDPTRQLPPREHRVTAMRGDVSCDAGVLRVVDDPHHLARAFATHGRWLRAEVTAEQGMRLVAIDAVHARGLLDELAAAASIGLAWIELDGVADTRFELTVDPDTLALVPSRDAIAVARTLSLGLDPGASSPTASEWRDVFSRARLCIPHRYQDALDAIEGPPTCTALADLVEGPEEPSHPTWVVHRPVRLVANGEVRMPPARFAVCRPADCPRSAIAVVGDVLATHLGAAWACRGGACSPLDAGGATALLEPGLVEVRMAPTLDAAVGADALTVFRVLVIDASRHWVPLGLLDGSATPERSWSALPWEGDVVGVVSRANARTGVAVSRRVAALLRSTEPALGGELPVEVPMIGPGPAPTRGAALPRLVTFVRGEVGCPREPASEVRRGLRSLERVQRDDVVYLTLAEQRAVGAPLDCLATVALRPHEGTTVATAFPLRLVVLSDVMLYAALAEPLGLVAYWNAGALLAHLIPELAIELGVGASLGFSFTGELERAGLGVSLTLALGPREAPRVIRGGVLWTPVTSEGVELALVAPVLGVDLTALLGALGVP